MDIRVSCCILVLLVIIYYLCLDNTSQVQQVAATTPVENMLVTDIPKQTFDPADRWVGFYLAEDPITAEEIEIKISKIAPRRIRFSKTLIVLGLAATDLIVSQDGSASYGIRDGRTVTGRLDLGGRINWEGKDPVTRATQSKMWVRR